MLEKEAVSSEWRAEPVPTASWSQLLNNQKVVAFFFLLPALLVLCFVVIYPFFTAIVMSFQNKMVGAPASYIGFANYVELFGDPKFFQVIKNTLVYTFFAVGIKFLLGLSMALVLAQDRPFNYIYRTILFVPWAVPTIVAALSFRWIYDDFSGMLNNFILAVYQPEELISWLGDPNMAMGSVVAVVVWSGTPFYTMSFLAGLKAIPKEMYEAARIDGAGTWHEFWYITIPQMRKVFTIVVMLSTIWTSTNLVIVQILTNGGPANSSASAIFHIFTMAIKQHLMGYASALSVLLFVTILVLTLTQRWLLRETA